MEWPLVFNHNLPALQEAIAEKEVIEQNRNGIIWCSYPSYTLTRREGKIVNQEFSGKKELSGQEFMSALQKLSKVGWGFELTGKEQLQLQDMNADLPDKALVDIEKTQK